MMGLVCLPRLMREGVLGAFQTRHEIYADGSCAGIMPMSPEWSQYLRLSGALCFGKWALDSLHALLAPRICLLWDCRRASLRSQPASRECPVDWAEW
jgi:hypothetical protein